MKTRSEARIKQGGPPLRPVSRLRGAIGALLLVAPLAGCAGEALTSSPTENEPVVLVSVTPSAVSLTIGGTAQLTAVVTDGEGNPVAGAAVSWSSSNEPSATVDANGLVTAVAEGSASITATSEGESGSAAVTVTTSVGDLQVNTSTTGSNLDPDGYTATVDGSQNLAIGINGQVTFSGLAAGSHNVQLGGVAGNCTVSGANPRTVTVTTGGTAQTTFSVTCSGGGGGGGSLQVNTSTSGANLDPNGYTVGVDGSQGVPIAVNGSVTFNALSQGDHSVQLSGVAANCTVSGANPRTVAVPASGTAQTTFQVNCSGSGNTTCEAQGGASCWYVAPGGSDANPGTLNQPFGTPQHAANVAGPGDFIYLRGGVYSGDIETSSAGQPGAVITMKSTPGELAIIQDGHIFLNRSYWWLEGVKVEGPSARIGVGLNFVSDVHDVWIVGNEVTGYQAPLGNSGLIKLTGNVGVNPYNIYIWNNVIHNMIGSLGEPWHQDPDTEHHACIMVMQGSGRIEIKNNELYHCASAFYFKFTWDGPVVVENNRIHDTQKFGQLRNGNNEFRFNVVWGMSAGPRTQSDVSTGYIFERNTLVDLDPAYIWNILNTQTSRDNVIFGANYLQGSSSATGSPAGSDMDQNCFITPQSFDAFEGLSLQQFQQQYGKELNSVRIIETNPAAVFADPANHDYRLIGAAATQCQNKGAY